MLAKLRWSFHNWMFYYGLLDSDMANFLLIDDHSIITTGLWLLLSKEFPGSHINTANTGLQAFDHLREKEFDVVVLDLNLPDIDSVQVLDQIRTKNTETKVLIFSMQPEEVFAKRMYDLGANGYLCKTANDEEIVKAANCLLSGKSYFSERFIHKMTDDLINKRSSNPFDKLSKREFEITMYLIQGIPMSRISIIMNLHKSTIGTYKAKVYEKIGVDNTIALKQVAEQFSIHVSVIN